MGVGLPEDMEMSESLLIFALAALNLFAGAAIAAPIAKRLRRERSVRFLWCYAACLGVYVTECVAFAMGMATQVCTLTLAIGWGIILGTWLPDATPLARAWRLASLLGAYGSFPTVTFSLLVAVAWFWNGGLMLTAEAGHQFGIPEFVPWPLSTILGFCVALGLGTLVLKCVLTGLAALCAARWRRARVVRSIATAKGSTPSPVDPTLRLSRERTQFSDSAEHASPATAGGITQAR